MSLYLTTVVLVPKSLQDVEDTYAYFFKGRKWFFSLFILTLLVDIVDTALKGSDWLGRSTFLPQMALYFTLALIGMFSKSHKLQAFAGLGCFFAITIFTFIDQPILGDW